MGPQGWAECVYNVREGGRGREGVRGGGREGEGEGGREGKKEGGGRDGGLGG